jgi:hypothetical protein
LKAKDVLIRVGLSWLGCSIIGAGVGALLGKISPGFVTALFRVDLEPVQTGLGLGMVNGGIVGLVLGILIVLVEAFGRRD